jgi:hypothetical protein
MTGFDARSARRRYLVLTALRWLPVGLLIPIFVLVPLSRGLSLTEIGLVFAVQGLVVLAPAWRQERANRTIAADPGTLAA